jgi:hypothetical protein
VGRPNLWPGDFTAVELGAAIAVVPLATMVASVVGSVPDVRSCRDLADVENDLVPDGLFAFNSSRITFGRFCSAFLSPFTTYAVVRCSSSAGRQTNVPPAQACLVPALDPVHPSSSTLLPLPR